MNVEPNDPPREFRVAPNAVLRDCGSVTLEPGEQVTFRTEAGSAHDVVRTEWGFYATSSLNGRLPEHGLRPALVRNPQGRTYVLLVECEATFERYRVAHALTVVAWLDRDESH